MSKIVRIAGHQESKPRNNSTKNGISRVLRLATILLLLFCIGSSGNIYSAPPPEKPVPPTVPDFWRARNSTNTGWYATGSQLRWYSDKDLNNLVHTGSTFKPTETTPGKYNYYVTQSYAGLESDAYEAHLYVMPASPEAKDLQLNYGEDVPDLEASGLDLTWYSASVRHIGYNEQTDKYYSYTALGNRFWHLENNATPTKNGSSFYGGDSTWQSNIYGRLYNWTAANEVCEDDWYLPTDDDWKELETFLGMDPKELDKNGFRGNDEGGKLKDGSYFWTAPNTGASNQTGFTALPGGFASADLKFKELTESAKFWTSSGNNGEATYRSLSYEKAKIYRGEYSKEKYLSVRCIHKSVLLARGNSLISGKTLPGTYQFYITQRINGIESLEDTLTLSIILPAPIPDDNQIMCEDDETPKLQASGENLSWYGDKELTELLFKGEAYQPTVSAPGKYTFYITQTIGDVESKASTILLTIKAKPLPPKANNVAVCIKDEIPNLEATGVNVRWYTDSGLSNLVYEGNFYNTGNTSPGTYSYYVTQTITSCESNAKVVSLEIVEFPVKPSGGSLTFCENEAILPLRASGRNVKWYADHELTILVHEGNLFTTGHTQPGIYPYFATQTTGSCEGEWTLISLTILSAPEAPIVKDEIACEKSDIPNLTAQGENVKWYDSKDLNTPVFSGNSFDTKKTDADLYTYFATQSNLNCESSAAEVSLLINEIPDQPASEDVYVCQNQTVPDLIAHGNNIHWYADKSLTQLLHIGNTFATGEELVGSYNYFVTQKLNSCESLSEITNLSIEKQLGVPTTSPSQTICEGEIMEPLKAKGKHVRWYADRELTQLLYEGNNYYPDETNPGTYEYFVTQTEKFCESKSKKKSLNIEEQPQFTLGQDMTILYDQTITLASDIRYPYNRWSTGSTQPRIKVSGKKYGAGLHLIWLNASGYNHCSNSDSVLVEIKEPASTGNNGFEEIAILYPIPVKDKLNIVPVKNLEKTRIEIFSQQGEMLIHKRVWNFENEIQIDLSHLKTGVYIVKIRNANYNISKGVFKE